MKKRLIIIVCFFLSFLLFKPFSNAAPLFDANVEGALVSADAFFKAMKDKNYPKIWSLLTQRSKDVIVDDVYKAEDKTGVQHSREKINEDFNKGVQLARIYWNSFLDNFNPDTVIDQSKWNTGKFERNRGEVIVHYRKSDHPATLQMFKEDGTWKVGLVETFWPRKK